MKKDIKNIALFLFIVVIVIFLSYFIFKSGTTDKIKASVERNTASFDNALNYGNLPKVDSIINSSGENLVNSDVAIIIRASSKYNIDNVEYSYDLKKWKKIGIKETSKEIEEKIVIKKTIQSDIYIRVTNVKGYQSYLTKTYVNIDKEKPSVGVLVNKDISLKVSDNIGLNYIQYSNDKVNWNEEKVSGEQIYMLKENFNYKYIRAVDTAGNISEIKTID